MACVRRLLRLGIYYILSHSCWHYGKALANNISVQQVFVFSQCQSGLLVDCCDTCWWVLSRWFLEHRIGLCDARYFWSLVSPWLVVLLWVSMPVYPHFAASVVLISCRQCWPYKDLWRLAFFIGHPKNGGAKVRRKSHRWEFSTSMMREKMEDWALLSWHWSVNSVNNKRFGHSQLKAYFPHPSFSAETSIKHLRLHLLCLGNSQFENGIRRAFGPSRLVWSSDSLYL